MRCDTAVALPRGPPLCSRLGSASARLSKFAAMSLHGGLEAKLGPVDGPSFTASGAPARWMRGSFEAEILAEESGAARGHAMVTVQVRLCSGASSQGAWACEPKVVQRRPAG